ncbi:uncharacterized protein LOC124706691 [Lolium rigidum]|uniref:uncharacterized protein LOC124706691 n=1 Tax=Lolium rigidum TaxID=89674 RepID=UPI001F5CE345|nr:uncharacterized protein LOC124706691 [Lolium rigidum]
MSLAKILPPGKVGICLAGAVPGGGRRRRGRPVHAGGEGLPGLRLLPHGLGVVREAAAVGIGAAPRGRAEVAGGGRWGEDEEEIPSVFIRSASALVTILLIYNLPSMILAKLLATLLSN